MPKLGGPSPPPPPPSRHSDETFYLMYDWIMQLCSEVNLCNKYFTCVITLVRDNFDVRVVFNCLL